VIDSLLLTATRVETRNDEVVLTNATGFFFERDARLLLVTSRHVMHDEPNDHGVRSANGLRETTPARRGG
jgi:hypothetical protein